MLSPLVPWCGRAYAVAELRAWSHGWLQEAGFSRCTESFLNLLFTEDEGYHDIILEPGHNDTAPFDPPGMYPNPPLRSQVPDSMIRS